MDGNPVSTIMRVSTIMSMSEIARYQAFSPGEISGRKIPLIITQHAEEAAFLWLLRDAAVRAPHYSLNDLVKLDERVEAHLDGLRVAGDTGWAICQKALEGGDAGEVFAAAVLAFESGNAERIQGVVKAGTAEIDVSRGLISALGWLPYEAAEKHIQALLAAESPIARRAGIAAMAIHRQSPRRALTDALADSDPAIKARALRAVGELGLIDLHPAVHKGLKDPDEACRFWAAWSAALLFPDKDALAILQTTTETAGPFRERAVQLAMRRMELPAARRWLGQLTKKPEQARVAAIGAGVLGDPEWVPWLMEQMKVPPLARVAGEAFSMITGVDIAYQDLEGEKPEGFEAGPTEDPKDENVAMDEDENLPWPEPALIQKWWDSHRGEFTNGNRYLLGKPVSSEWLHEVLRTGRQRQRSAAALELAVRQRGHRLFEVRAPGFRQQQTLGKTTSVV